MEYEELVAIINEYGEENVVALYFDNSRTKYFPDGDFKLSDFKNVNGTAVYMSKEFLLSDNKITKNGYRSGKGGFWDIPVTVANSGLQDIIFLDNPEDRERINWGELYMR